MWTVWIVDDLCALLLLIYSQRKHNENEVHYNIQATLELGTSVSVAYLSLWGVPGLEWYIHNELQHVHGGTTYIENLIHDLIADRRCSWSYTLGNEIPPSNPGTKAIIQCAVSHHLTLWDADLRCSWTSSICQQKLWLWNRYVSCIIFQRRYWLTWRLYWLPNGIGIYALCDLS